MKVACTNVQVFKCTNMYSDKQTRQVYVQWSGSVFHDDDTCYSMIWYSPIHALINMMMDSTLSDNDACDDDEHLMFILHARWCWIFDTYSMTILFEDDTCLMFKEELLVQWVWCTGCTWATWIYIYRDDLAVIREHRLSTAESTGFGMWQVHKFDNLFLI